MLMTWQHAVGGGGVGGGGELVVGVTVGAVVGESQVTVNEGHTVTGGM